MLKDKTFWGLIVSVFIMMAGVGMIMALLPQKIIGITGSGDTIGFLAASFAISYIFAQLPIGSLADRIGFKPLLSGGYFLCSGAGIFYYFSDTANMVFMGRFLQGLGEAPVWALAPALLSARYPHMKGKAMGIYTAALHLGLTMGPVLGIAIQRTCPGNHLFLIYTLLCLAGTMMVQTGTYTAGPGQADEKLSLNLKKITAVLSTRMALITLAGIAFYGAGYGVFITIIPVFLITVKGFTPVLTGIFFSTFYIGISISQIMIGPLSDAYGRMKFMVTGLVVAAMGLVIFQFPDFHWAICVLGLVSLGLGSFFLSSLAYLNEMVSKSLSGTISGAYFLFWGIGYFTGPLVIGMGEKQIGPGRGIDAFACLLLCEAALLALFHGLDCPRNANQKT